MFSRNLKAISALLLGNFFFATSIVAVKHISPSLIQPMALTAIRVGGTAFLFWLFFGLKSNKNYFKKADFYIILICAITGIAMNQNFSIKGMSLTSPIHASLLVLTTPIVITLLAAFFLKEKLTRTKMAGLLLGIMGGVLLVFSRDISVSNKSNQALGDMFIIFGAISYSTYVILMKSIAHKYSNTAILKWVFLIGSLLSIPLGWHDLQLVQWAMFDELSWFCLLYIVIGATFFAYQLVNFGIHTLGASVAGSYIYAQPFFASISAIVFLNESLSLTKFVSAGLIMTGVFLANYKPQVK
jgi:drug/metabolite transporter (DMT)-like permease